MNILIAPDKFKDSLSGQEVGEAFSRGLDKLDADFNTKIIPMADGGEGTVKALVEATRGIEFNVRVNDPLMRPVNAHYGILGDDETAILEMASASGIELLQPEERNPMLTSTFGTGELIVQALDRGCKRIILGIGGSATNDGGTGMAQALGVKFFGGDGALLIQGGGDIAEIQKIDISGIDKRIFETEFIVACDVTNPLTGPTGASHIYGPQKGATSDMVLELDANLNHLAQLINKRLGIDVDSIPGSGAAGGLGAGLLAFTEASLQPGFQIVSKETNLEKHLQWADIVVTGEGKIDHQTQFGKTPLGVAKLAKKYGKPVLAIAGTLGQGYTDLYKLGFDGIFSIIDRPMNLEEAILTASDLIERSAESIFRTYLSAKM